MLKMLKAFFERSRVPSALREELGREGLLLLDPCVRFVLNYRKYKSPRARFGRKRHGWTGFVALTERRLVGSGYSRDFISIQLDKIRPDNLKFENRDDSCLWLSLDVSEFATDRAGSVECRYYTAQARRFVEALQKAAER